MDPQKVERQNREEFLPLVLAGLKNYVETGEPLPTPERKSYLDSDAPPA